MNTTLNKIREHHPCTSSWEALLESLGKTKADDDPLSMLHILETLNVQDFLWATRTLPEHKDVWVGLACDFAEHVLPIFETKYPKDKRPRECILATRKFLLGEITREELLRCRRAADAAATDAAAAAAATYAADADAATAAYAAAAAAADAAAAYAAAATAYAAVYAADAADAAYAVDAAYAAAAAERKWQKERIIEVLGQLPREDKL